MHQVNLLYNEIKPKAGTYEYAKFKGSTIFQWLMFSTYCSKVLFVHGHRICHVTGILYKYIK